GTRRRSALYRLSTTSDAARWAFPARPCGLGSRGVLKRSLGEHRLELEVHHAVEQGDPRLDLVGAGFGQAPPSEVLDRDGGHGGARGQRLAQRAAVLAAAARQPAEEAGRERVAGAGRVAQRLDRIGRRQEALVAAAVDRAVLALLDDHGVGAL